MSMRPRLGNTAGSKKGEGTGGGYGVHLSELPIRWADGNISKLRVGMPPGRSKSTGLVRRAL